MENKKKLSNEVYDHFSKDNMTSAYQDRIIKIFNMVDKGKLKSLDEAKKYYASLKPIKETNTRRVDKPLTESEWGNR